MANDYKKFGKKYYRIDSYSNTKKAADKKTKNIRDQGYCARAVKDGKRYAIYKGPAMKR